ncbi:Uncharacterized protein dnm_027220 [Desulfonema magnum]|uniref:Uncharacterized protein n=1 Tax=Desulfonema magnum TaxID=45655 RepID=A0A975GNB2_9BACT|nr:Uncharacterized protein dnm_027220 [Desulfonema magnum]
MRLRKSIFRTPKKISEYPLIFKSTVLRIPAGQDMPGQTVSLALCFSGFGRGFLFLIRSVV